MVLERPILSRACDVRRQVVIRRPVRTVVVNPYPITVQEVYVSDVNYWLGQLVGGDRRDREKAAKRLAEFQGTQVRIALEHALLADSDDDVREQAAESLGHIRDSLALSALRHAALTDSDDDVREEALEAIERINRAA